jgi:uncharacterized protein (TIGR03067 family)
MRALTLVFLAALSFAFAPAPFPRPQRAGRQPDDLERLQGWWDDVSHNGRPSEAVREIKGDIWNHDTPKDSWIITLAPHAQPPRIDLVRVGDRNSFFRGIYKWEGDTFTYSVRYRCSEEDRPRDFDTTKPWSWVTELKRRTN